MTISTEVDEEVYSTENNLNEEEATSARKAHIDNSYTIPGDFLLLLFSNPVPSVRLSGSHLKLEVINNAIFAGIAEPCDYTVYFNAASYLEGIVTYSSFILYLAESKFFSLPNFCIYAGVFWIFVGSVGFEDEASHRKLIFVTSREFYVLAFGNYLLRLAYVLVNAVFFGVSVY